MRRKGKRCTERIRARQTHTPLGRDGQDYTRRRPDSGKGTGDTTHSHGEGVKNAAAYSTEGLPTKQFNVSCLPPPVFGLSRGGLVTLLLNSECDVDTLNLDMQVVLGLVMSMSYSILGDVRLGI
ncbi:hypothetical protein E2C01_043856 [Portunus trituberculatus]|uniref:Uncharacterized protein n=1 Tax=Portunus trituberculatus TaxID=210409 RepID=A0A5B7FWT1_PORTR|nr:hypothetical protein [Portunus trituberculatus]